MKLYTALSYALLGGIVFGGLFFLFGTAVVDALIVPVNPSFALVWVLLLCVAQTTVLLYLLFKSKTKTL